MTKPAKHIVFDWNGTLFDDAPAVLETFNQVLSEVGRPPIDMAKFHRAYCMPFSQFYMALGFSEAEAKSLNGAFDKHYEPRAARVGLRAGAKEILDFAHRNGLRKTILSNHITDAIRVQLSRLEIGHYFSDVIAYAGRDGQNRSPSKGERLRHYMNDNGHAANDALIVGDSPEEIEIARDLGMVGVAITGGCTSEERLKAARPDHLIHSLNELHPILKQRGLVP